MARDPERRAELTEHLAELRARLIRSVIYIVVGFVAAWLLYPRLLAILMRPMREVLDRVGSKFLLTGFPEAFMIQVQVCLIAGLIFTLPLLTLELWGFVSPGLTREEKRPLRWLVPLAIVLFASGVTMCYVVLPAAFRWFVSYVPEGAELRPTVQGSLLFTLKMLLAFGVSFEMPVVLMLLAKVGIIDAKLLTSNWRYAMVGVCVMAAVATPSGDALTMMTLAAPLAGLYFLSILFVRFVQPKRPRD